MDIIIINVLFLGFISMDSQNIFSKKMSFFRGQYLWKYGCNSALLYSFSRANRIYIDICNKPKNKKDFFRIFIASVYTYMFITGNKHTGFVFKKLSLALNF